MSQTSLDDDELFGEAAEDMAADIRDSLDAARTELPDPDAIWDVDADNALGVLNGLKSALDVGDAEADLRDAKKWFTMGERADAFEDADALEAEIAEVEELLADVAEAREAVGDVAATLPQLRSALQDAHEGADPGADGEEAAAEGE
jgi:hypothetical protein